MYVDDGYIAGVRCGAAIDNIQIVVDGTGVFIPIEKDCNYSISPIVRKKFNNNIVLGVGGDFCVNNTSTSIGACFEGGYKLLSMGYGTASQTIRIILTFEIRSN